MSGKQSRCLLVVEAKLRKEYTKKANVNWRGMTRRMAPTHSRRMWGSGLLVRRRLSEAVVGPPAACSQIGCVAITGDLDDTGLSPPK